MAVKGKKEHPTPLDSVLYSNFNSGSGSNFDSGSGFKQRSFLIFA